LIPKAILGAAIWSKVSDNLALAGDGDLAINDASRPMAPLHTNLGQTA
jgi:hypothetical protein